jgi:hypothetical protein
VYTVITFHANLCVWFYSWLGVYHVVFYISCQFIYPRVCLLISVVVFVLYRVLFCMRYIRLVSFLIYAGGYNLYLVGNFTHFAVISLVRCYVVLSSILHIFKRHLTSSKNIIDVFRELVHFRHVLFISYFIFLTTNPSFLK